jgi:nitrite reductase/ring-hydroxylating ferredoxin subunit
MTVTLCTLDEIPTNQAIERADPRAEDGTTIVLLRQGEQVRAYLNICPHAGRPLNWAPGRFLYDHGQLVCAAHGASFRPEDGYCIGGPCKGESLRSVPIAILGGEVQLIDTGGA